jgi:hypothetical protein
VLNIAGNLWSVKVKTGDVFRAGTGAEIHITIFGDKATGGPYLLEGPAITFEQGREDHFQVAMVDFGDAYKLRVESDGAGFLTDWRLDTVIADGY